MSKELTKSGAVAMYDEATEKLVFRLNQDPSERVVKRNPHAGNSLYIPISEVEMTLDKMFQGLWQTRNFSHQVVTNEIVGSLELGVYHPHLREWIWRTGTASVMIQQKRGSEITDIGAKIKNTLVKDFPHLKTECVKNAARSLGKLFGRDLNRDDESPYMPGSTEEAIANAEIDKILKQIEDCTTTEQLGPIFTKYAGVPGVPSALISTTKTTLRRNGRSAKSGGS